jgi:pimeloyl-ACP methyl ester carboxylesterase
MKPFYFGPSEKQLFGVYHAPQIRAAVSHGVVLCYPMGQEYYYTHRAFLQLALRLSKNGFPVLRFDYYGCGDSAGEAADGNLDEWLRNIKISVDEIKRMAGVEAVSLVGFRLGATLAMLAGGSRGDVRNVALWEPILNGIEYMQELSLQHDNWLKGNLPGFDLATIRNGYDEVIGMPFTDTLQEGLKGIDLLAPGTRVADSVAVISNDGDDTYHRLVDQLRSCAGMVEFQQIEGQQDLFTDAGMDTMHVPVETLQFIVSWIKKVCV